MRLAKQNGLRKATVAVARKLITRSKGSRSTAGKDVPAGTMAASIREGERHASRHNSGPPKGPANELYRLFDRNNARFRPAQNFVDVVGAAPEHVRQLTTVKTLGLEVLRFS
jgi:hypothetical protein